MSVLLAVKPDIVDIVGRRESVIPKPHSSSPCLRPRWSWVSETAFRIFLPEMTWSGTKFTDVACDPMSVNQYRTIMSRDLNYGHCCRLCRAPGHHRAGRLYLCLLSAVADDASLVMMTELLTVALTAKQSREDPSSLYETDVVRSGRFPKVKGQESRSGFTFNARNPAWGYIGETLGACESACFCCISAVALL